MKTRTIRITQVVWDAIATQGKFGETENDVLERILGITKASKSESPVRRTIATNKMTSKIEEGSLYLGFATGASERWKLPQPDNKNEIRKILNLAFKFADNNDATYGQRQAIRNTLNVAGYHLSR